MTKKVANIIEEGKFGGPQNRIVIAAALMKDRVETVVVLPKENSEEFKKKCDEFGVHYVAFSLSRITKEWQVACRYIFFSFFEIVALAKYLKKNKFDLVHVSGGSWQFKGVFAAKLAKIKVVWHLNDTFMPNFVKKIFSFICPLADGFIYASERSRNYYLPIIRDKKKEFIIPAPVDTQKFDPENELNIESEDDILNQIKGKVVIGTVANINPIKGIDVLIQSIAHLNKKVDNAHFVVIGPVYKNQQTYFNKLQKTLGQLGVQNLSFTGGCTNIISLLKRFDIYVCSSRAESSPLSVWEAMSMSKPIVSTNVGDVPLYVQNNFNGFVVDVGDSSALAIRLQQLVNNIELRVLFGNNSREIAVRELDSRICADKHYKAYSEMIDSEAILQ